MTVLQGESANRATTPHFMDVLAYEAPFLIEKLLKEHIVETPQEGQSLFSEVKKYLLLVHSDDTKIWEMYSLRIDEVWHQFILFTKEYIDFCNRFFGRYLPHSPSNAPKAEETSSTEVASFHDFQNRYIEFFGEPLPDLWHDEKSVTSLRRVLNDHAGLLTLRQEGEMIDLLTPSGEVLLSVNELAREALAFIARTGAFYVRELPGGLDDEEKIALVATLVEYSVLRVGS